jgi:hypothetical protein
MSRGLLWGTVALAVVVVLAATTTLWRRASSSLTEMAPTASEPGGPAGAVADPVRDFTDFARTAASPDAESGAGYVTVGLRTLAGALACLGLDRDDLAVDLRVGAVHVEIQPASLENAALVQSLTRRVADQVASATADDSLRVLAQTIAADRPVTDQIPAFEAFFRAVSMRLDALAARRGSPSTRPCQA